MIELICLFLFLKAMDSSVYLDTLENYAFSQFEGGVKCIFQQDGAPPYSGNVVWQQFNSHWISGPQGKTSDFHGDEVHIMVSCVKMEAAWPSETLVSYHITIQSLLGESFM